MKSFLIIALLNVVTAFAGNCSKPFAQCGGLTFKGATCCVQGYVCNKHTEYYSQCIPGNSNISEMKVASNNKKKQTNNNQKKQSNNNQKKQTNKNQKKPANNNQKKPANNNQKKPANNNQKKPVNNNQQQTGNKSQKQSTNVPPKPAVTYLNSNNDPAVYCDISDSIRGDSLKNSAPFRVGVGLYGTNKASSPIFSKKMRDIIKYQFNSVTFTNLMKADQMLNKSACQANARAGNDTPVLKFDSIVDGLEFCKANNIKMRGHTLVWHSQAPDWFFRVGYNDYGTYVDKNTMSKRMESYIKQMLNFVQTYYPGVVDVWDVVNEAVEINPGEYDATSGWNTRTKANGKPNPWYTTMGPDYVFHAFRYARKYAAPGTKLVYNDFNTFMSKKNAGICNLVRRLKAENLIDAVGLQSYLDPTWPNRNDYKNAIKNFASLGVDIQITELTITSDGTANKFNTQANQYAEVFKIYKDLKNSGVKITSVTMFGLQDNYLFYPNDKTDTRLWDRNLKKKPVYNAIMRVLKS